MQWNSKLEERKTSQSYFSFEFSSTTGAYTNSAAEWEEKTMRYPLPGSCDATHVGWCCANGFGLRASQAYDLLSSSDW